MCAASKLFLPAILAGIAAASLTGQPIAGWIVAGLVAALLYVSGRRRAESFACVLAPQRTDRRPSAADPTRPDREVAPTTTVDRCTDHGGRTG